MERNIKKITRWETQCIYCNNKFTYSLKDTFYHINYNDNPLSCVTDAYLRIRCPKCLNTMNHLALRKKEVNSNNVETLSL